MFTHVTTRTGSLLAERKNISVFATSEHDDEMMMMVRQTQCDGSDDQALIWLLLLLLSDCMFCAAGDSSLSLHTHSLISSPSQAAHTYMMNTVCDSPAAVAPASPAIGDQTSSSIQGPSHPPSLSLSSTLFEVQESLLPFHPFLSLPLVTRLLTSDESRRREEAAAKELLLLLPRTLPPAHHLHSCVRLCQVIVSREKKKDSGIRRRHLISRLMESEIQVQTQKSSDGRGEGSERSGRKSERAGGLVVRRT